MTLFRVMKNILVRKKYSYLPDSEADMREFICLF